MALSEEVINDFIANYIELLEKPSVAKLAEIYNVSRDTIYKLIKAHSLEDRRIATQKNRQKSTKLTNLPYEDFFYNKNKALIEDAKIHENLKAYFKLRFKEIEDERQRGGTIDDNKMNTLLKQLNMVLQNGRLVYGEKEEQIKDLIEQQKTNDETEYVAEFKDGRTV